MKDVQSVRVQKTSLDGVKLIFREYIRERHEWRAETYSWPKFYGAGITTLFTVDYETKIPFQGTLRGLYYQNDPQAQSLLIHCAKGKILQAVVDLRPSSQQYGKGVLFELSEEVPRDLYVPAGFAQGFLTMSDNVEIRYKADKPCSSFLERTLNYADPEVGLPWPEVEDLIVSVKDKTAPYLHEVECNYL